MLLDLLSLCTGLSCFMSVLLPSPKGGSLLHIHAFSVHPETYA